MAPPKGHPDWAAKSRTCRAQRKHGRGVCRNAVTPGKNVCRVHGANAGHPGKRGADHPAFKTGASVGVQDLRAIRADVAAMAAIAGVTAYRAPIMRRRKPPQT